MPPFSAALARAAAAERASLVLANATVPVCLAPGADLAADEDGLARADVVVEAGRVAAVRPLGCAPAEDLPRVDLDRGMVLPLFVDMHTHLDKGHIWPRRRNPDGKFMSALEAVRDDSRRNWSAEDVRRRMEFSLRAAYAHGTRAIRTHLDSIPPQHGISWPVFAEMRAAWAGRIDLQAVSLVGPDSMGDPAVLDTVAETVKAHGGVFGGAIGTWPTARQAVANTVAAARRHGLDLDLHVDETEDPSATSLRFLAEEVLAQGFKGRVVAGHCCSLARQDGAEQDRTLDLVAEAGIAVVSLPMCNMYLQDRDGVTAGGRGTPRWRGVTLLHEMKARGIEVAVASDNTRDPFYAYGDLDGLEVLREATRILHLDHPFGDWPSVMSRSPADILGLPDFGRIAAGLSADLVVVGARGWTELFSRPQADRMVLRGGSLSRATLPDYRDLDDLLGA
jgi:cytosine deaminase